MLYRGHWLAYVMEHDRDSGCTFGWHLRGEVGGFEYFDLGREGEVSGAAACPLSLHQGKLLDVDRGGAETAFAVGEVEAPHTSEALVKAERLDLRPFLLETFTPVSQGLCIILAESRVRVPFEPGFGDLALAIGPQFEKYVAHVMQMLGQAAQTTVPEDDEDMVEYLNTLREAILEGMTGMLQGLHNNGQNSRAAVMKPFMPAVIQLLTTIAHDQNRDESVSKNAVGLLGDILL